MLEYQFGEFTQPTECLSSTFPLVELERSDWEKRVSEIAIAGSKLIEENQISKWYKNVLPYAHIPIIRNAGPCSAAVIVDTEQEVALAHFTPDISVDEIKRLMNEREIKSGKILVPFPRSTIFSPILFRKKIEFFQALNLEPIVPSFIESHGVPTVVNMAFDADKDRVIYGITYDKNLGQFTDLYKTAFTQSQ